MISCPWYTVYTERMPVVSSVKHKHAFHGCRGFWDRKEGNSLYVWMRAVEPIVTTAPKLILDNP